MFLIFHISYRKDQAKSMGVKNLIRIKVAKTETGKIKVAKIKTKTKNTVKYFLL